MSKDAFLKKSWLGLCLLLPLPACSGGGGASVPAIQSIPQTPQVGSQTEPLAALSVAPSSDLLYVGNVGNNSITVYKHDAQGNSAPIKVIAGSKTGINKPGQLAQDSQGNLYVANGGFDLTGINDQDPAILVFAHGSNGNTAPIRRISGPLTGIHNVSAMTVDPTTGKMFVIDVAPGGTFNFNTAVLRFAPNANGNVAPLARSTDTSAGPAVQIANDSSGAHLIVGYKSSEFDGIDAITTVAKQFSPATYLPDVYLVQSFFVAGLVDDPATKTYLVASGSYGIYRLAETTTGNGPATNPGGKGLQPAAVSVITSDVCGSQLSLGYLRNIYVTHSVHAACSKDGVYVYSHDSSGNVPPLRILSGPATKMNQPYGIYEGK